MTFEEWWADYKQYCPIMTQEEMAEDAWKAAFEEGYKFANKENKEYDKIGC